ncbi:MAG: V-type ATPase subunit [Candidatus Diapherotrites archaeon]|uniref:A-type ATP synthase subunit C n=2 Tax=Candidatus Iainarchaeum sp. TaxID=3101447 RepID=A0A8T4LFW8_9ARCH|nr:V-type ATPase subunit [Candidatus Diapherotrites archaeon]
MVYGLEGSTAARALTYGYSNARVKAMQALLFKGKDLEALVGASDLKEVIGFLERTSYREDLVATSLNYSGINRVELALGLNYARAASKLLKIAPKAALPVLAAILRKWDVHNLKTILLGKYEKKPRAEIEPYLVRCGSLSKATLARLLEEDSIQELVGLLAGTEYGWVLERAWKKFGESKDMNAFLEALDLHYYAKLAVEVSDTGGSERVIRQLVEAEVDAKNLVNALRLRREGKTDEYIGSLFVPGGSLDREELQALLKAHPQGEKGFEALLLAAQKRMGLAPSEGGIVPSKGAGKSLAALETRLAHRIVEQSLRTLRRSILSLGALVGFLYLKENEVNNVRKVIRAKEYRLPPAMAKEMLIIPS